MRAKAVTATAVLTLACGVALGLVPARAQYLPQNGPAQGGRQTEPAPLSRIGPNTEEHPSVPPPVSNLPPARGITGPHLDVGAVLCRTDEDLQHRAAVGRRISDGDSDPGDPLENCRLITQPRAVDIISRAGLGRSQVRLKPSGETGWTDAYLR
jgi:hypothetical protein